MSGAVLAKLGTDVAALHASVVVALPDGIVAAEWTRPGRDGFEPPVVADLARLIERQADVLHHLVGTRAPSRMAIEHGTVRVLVEPLREGLVACLAFAPDYPEALAVLHARQLADAWGDDSTGVPRRAPSPVARALSRLLRDAADPELAALRVALRARIRPQALMSPDELDERQAAAVCEQIEIVLRQPMPGLAAVGGS